MIKTILQKIRVELAILGEKKDHLSPMFPWLDAPMSKALRCVKLTDCASFLETARNYTTFYSSTYRLQLVSCIIFHIS